MMIIFYTCLLVLVSTGLSLSKVLPWDKNHLSKFIVRRNVFGASRGFKPANIKDYPYLTSIIIESDWWPLGAGAILNKHWVLSSAYATLHSYSPEDMKIYIETNNAGRSGQQTNVSKLITHEKFDLETSLLDYNIGLLKTEQPIQFSEKAKPVKLAKSVPKAGADCTLLGYGYLQDLPYVGWDLGAATIQVKSKSECEQEYGTLKTGYCAEADGVVPCYGDIGDLLIYKNKLVGIYVVGDYCNILNQSEVYTNIPAMKKWIWKTIKANSNEDELEGLSKEQFLED